MPSQLDCLHGNAFLQARITNRTPRCVIDQGESRPVVNGSQMLCGHGKADGIRDALSQRARGDFNTVILDLGVPGANGVSPLRVVGLELVHRHGGVPRQM